MKKHLIHSALAASALIAAPASAQSIIVVTSPAEHHQSVAFEQLQAGENNLAIEMLTNSKPADAHNPSRLINLGTAYARQGRVSEAKAAFTAAATSPVRHDVELANGRFVDSRWAARAALRQL